MAASRKSAKYRYADLRHISFTVLGRKIGVSSGDERGGRFLFQRLSMALQRYNAILLHESLEFR